jgi:hypothetical protein
MKRRDFLKKSVVAAGLVGTLKAIEPLTAHGNPSPAPAPVAVPPGTVPTENRSADYLRRAQGEAFLPKPPVISARDQDITLMARHGIEEVSAPAGVLAAGFRRGSANCELRLPTSKSVEIHLKLGQRQPLEWVRSVA